MADDDYEILPHQLLSDLKYDVEALKKKLVEPDSKTNELILEIESLKDSIHELTGIFDRALKETGEEDVTKMVHSLNEQLRTVVSQNEVIAKGMIAISDKLEDFMKEQGGKASFSPQVIAPSQHFIGVPPTIGRVAPRPDMSIPAAVAISSPDLPPSPPAGGKKRNGLFKM